MTSSFWILSSFHSLQFALIYSCLIATDLIAMQSWIIATVLFIYFFSAFCLIESLDDDHEKDKIIRWMLKLNIFKSIKGKKNSEIKSGMSIWRWEKFTFARRKFFGRSKAWRFTLLIQRYHQGVKNSWCISIISISPFFDFYFSIFS